MFEVQRIFNMTCPFVLQEQNLICQRLIIAVLGNRTMHNKLLALCVHKEYPAEVFEDDIELPAYPEFIFRVAGIAGIL